MTARPAPFFVPNTALTSAALNDAQRYHIEAGRRHRASAHLPGVICGLTVNTEKDELLLAPGYAVDAFGRDLVLSESMPLEAFLSVARARSPQVDRFEVLLHYQQIPKKVGTKIDLDETPRVEIRASGSPSQPAVVNIVEPSPDDPAVATPVRVGVLQADPKQRDQWLFLANDEDRDESGLVAARIVPSRKEAASRLELSRDTFAVVLASPKEKEGAKRLIVDQHGATVSGALAVDGTIDVANALALSEPGPAADVPGFYRIAPQRKPDEPDVPPDQHELRLMLPPEGKLEIGAWNTQSKKFEAVLTVDARTRSVTIAGDLIIEGVEVKAAGSDAMGGTPPDTATGGGQNTREGTMQTVMDTIKGWFGTTMGSGMRLLLLLVLGYSLINWDRALTTLLPCETAQRIRVILGLLPLPVCSGNVLFGANCGVTSEQIKEFIKEASTNSKNEQIKEIFKNNPDVTVYCAPKGSAKSGVTVQPSATTQPIDAKQPQQQPEGQQQPAGGAAPASSPVTQQQPEGQQQPAPVAAPAPPATPKSPAAKK